MYSKSVGSYQAKTHLSTLLDDVLNGEHIVITRKGMPIAQLIPYEKLDNQSIDENITTLINFRKTANLHLKGLSVREMREEGQK